MAHVVTLTADEPEGWSSEIRHHLGLHSGDPLVLVKGKDFVLVKKASRVTVAERFDKLAAATHERVRQQGLGPEEVEPAVRWARDSS